MNLVVLVGRLARDPEVRRTTGEKASVIASYTLAVDRTGKDQGADFIRCVTFNKSAEFAEQYLKKGTKMIVRGHIQTGSYTNKDGQKVYTTDVIVDSQEFAEKKSSDGGTITANAAIAHKETNNNWMNVPDAAGDDEEMPW